MEETEETIRIENNTPALVFRETINHNNKLLDKKINQLNQTNQKQKITDQETEDQIVILQLETKRNKSSIIQNTNEIINLTKEVDNDYYDLFIEHNKMKSEICILQSQILMLTKPSLFKQFWTWLTYSHGLETPKIKH